MASIEGKAMNAKELRAAVNDLCKGIGPKAQVSLMLSEYKEPVYASIHPFGVGTSKGYIGIHADDWDEALEKLKVEWAKHSDEHKRQTVRDMALAIIRITAELGKCTDAALRAEFDAGTVAMWGDDACEAANQMADKGPFRIVRMRGANAAA